jgi:hypothetical protein
MVLLGDVGQVEAHFDPFGDSLISALDRYMVLGRMYHGYGNNFGHTRCYSYVMCVKWKSILVYLEIVLI